MTAIRVKNDRGGSYAVSGPHCIGCTCLRLGEYQVRGATLSGSRNTGQTNRCCMTRAYHGCPSEDEQGRSDELAKQRKRDGMRISL